MTRDSFFQELFNRPPTQEEQHRFDRIGSMMGLGQDDSMWYVILINEFYDNRLEERLKEIDKASDSVAAQALIKISETVKDKAAEIALSQNKGLLLRSWGLVLSVVVLLCCISVNAGYVMGSGKIPFWLQPSNKLEEIAGYFLNVPSGWILALCSSPFFLDVLFSSLKSIQANQRMGVKGLNGENGNLALKAIGASLSLVFIFLIFLAI